MINNVIRIKRHSAVTEQLFEEILHMLLKEPYGELTIVETLGTLELIKVKLITSER